MSSLKMSYGREPMQESLNALAKVMASAENKVFWMSIKKDGKATFLATDGNNFIKTMPLDKGNCTEDTTLCLPFAEFQTFVSNSRHDTVLMVVDDNQIVCGFKGEKGKYKFARYNVEAPAIPEMKDAMKDVLMFVDFSEALNKTAFSAHPAKTRSPISGVKLKINPDCFQAISTDTGRVSLFDKKFKVKRDTKPMDICLPRQTIDILKNLPYGIDVDISADKNMFQISSGNNFVFVGPQEALGDKFPEVNIFFTDTVLASVEMDTSSLEDKLSLADALTRSEEKMKKTVTIAIDGDYLLMKVVGSKTSMEEAIKCSEVTLSDENAKYKAMFPMHRLSEAMKVYDQPEVKISFVAPPKVISSVDTFILIEDENWKHLIMTMVEVDEQKQS